MGTDFSPRVGLTGDHPLEGGSLSMRRLRWMLVAFALVQFVLYQPPPGGELPFPRIPAALTVAAIGTLVNLAPRRQARTCPIAARARARIDLAADATTVLGVVWLFSFDPTSALWALLIIPVVEAAFVDALAGALLTWAALTSGYLARELWAARVYDHIRFMPESVSYRMGIVLFVAACVGTMARNLRAQVGGHQAARRESEHRAAMLRVVAASGRQVEHRGNHALSSAEAFEAVLAAASAVGFSAAALLGWTAGGTEELALDGVPASGDGRQVLDAAGLAQARAATSVTVVSSVLPGRLALAGHRQAIVSPVRDGDTPVGALVVARHGEGPPTGVDLEFVELLAAQAGTAVAAAARMAERSAYEQQLAHQAYHDQLTGLPNRSLFLDRLDQGVARTRRDGSCLAVLFLDLDRFKAVNDSYGHAVGDALLVAAGQRLEGLLRAADSVCRLGGDEFTVLLEGITRPADAMQVAAGIVTAMAEPFVIAGRRIYTSTSVGVALGDGGTAAPTLLRAADLAMYEAKRRGRGEVELFSPALDAEASARARMEEQLRVGLEDGQFELAYQPVLALSSGRVVAAEALLRWPGRAGGALLPDAFIPVAEDTGLIVPLGRWVLEEACRQVARWRAAGLADIRVAVNMSPIELVQPAVVGGVAAALEGAGIPAGALVLEVTERAVVDDAPATQRALAGLRDLGVDLAVDDFGQGQASFSRLRDAAFQVAKIDRAFVESITHRTPDQAIVRAIARLAGDLGLVVVAEGVETAAQLAMIRALGCDHAQGRHIGAPMSPSDLLLVARTLEASATSEKVS